MASFNKVVLMGNLTRDPEVRQINDKTSVTEFGLAANEKYRTAAGEDREDVLFVDCKVFGKRGEVIGQHFEKGKPILIEGRLKLDTWEDKNSGQKRSKHYVIVDNFSFVGGGNGGGDGTGREDRDRQAPPKGKARGGKRASEDPGSQFKEDDIPF